MYPACIMLYSEAVMRIVDALGYMKIHQNTSRYICTYGMFDRIHMNTLGYTRIRKKCIL